MSARKSNNTNPEDLKAKENNTKEQPKQDTEKDIDNSNEGKQEIELRVLIAFTDKYTDESYTVNDVITVNEVRAKELLTDSRRLVKKKD